MRRLVVAAALLALALPATAAADTVQSEVASLRPLAAAWWGKQGLAVRCPAGVSITVVQLTGYDGEARVGGCDMWLNTDLFTEERDGVRAYWWSDALFDARVHRQRAAYVCKVFLHEWGHLVGLGHASSGIMNGDGVWQVGAPADCMGWALARHPRPSRRRWFHRWRRHRRHLR